MEKINNIELNSVLARMDNKSLSKQTLLVERYEIERIGDYIELVEERLLTAKRELRLAEIDRDFLNETVKRYERNPICRLVFWITEKASAFKTWLINRKNIKNNRPKVKYMFNLQK